MTKPNKTGFAQAFSEAGRIYSEYTDTGIYLGKLDGFEVDKVRLNRTIARVTRGLFLNCENRRLDPSVKVNAYAVEGLSQQVKEKQKAVFIKMQKFCGETQSIGNDTFTWRYYVLPDQLETSFWILQVYEAITFIAFTVGEKHLLPLGSEV